MNQEETIKLLSEIMHKFSKIQGLDIETFMHGVIEGLFAAKVIDEYTRSMMLVRYY